MVFVTVGNATQGFMRLLAAVDNAAAQGVFGHEEVFVQSGNNPGFKPLHCEHRPFLDVERFEYCVTNSSLVISHAGAGTLLHVFQTGTIPVVMPRRKQHGELIDDHQFELVRVLAKEGRVIPAFEVSNLADSVTEARKHNLRPRFASTPRIVELVAKAIEELSSKKVTD